MKKIFRSRISVLFIFALSLTCGISLRAETTWTAGSITVTDLLDAANWDNGVPTKANPGTITGVTVTNSTLFKPASTVNSSVDLTFGQNSVINLSDRFIPFADLNNTGPALFNLTLTGNAKLNVTGNYWGGNNNSGPKGQLEGETYTANYTFGGDSVTTVSGEWWVAMSAKSHIIVKDNAQVISKSGNSGIGWNNNSVNSLMEIQGGLVQANSFYVGQGASNQTLNQTGGTLKVTNNLLLKVLNTDGSLPDPNLTMKYYLSGTDSVLTVTKNVYNSGLIEMSGGATATVGTYTGKGKLTVKDSATMNVTTYDSVGTNESIEKDGILNVTTFNAKSGNFGVNGGTVTVTELRVGTVASSNGTFTVNSGELNITNTLYMGSTANATGTFTQTGGTVNYTGVDREDPRVLLSTQDGAKSVMNLSGGNFNIKAGTFFLADHDTGTAELNISGKAALSTQEVRVGQHGEATVNMSAGTWTTNGNTFIVGHQDSVAHGIVKLSGTAELTTGNFRLAYTAIEGADASTGELEMSGSSKLTVNGSFIPFENVQKANAKALAKVTLSDKAQLYITGNFWGGSNSDTNYAGPRDGNDYAAYYTFGGESSLSCAEWWVAMSAKTYVLIKDSATVTSRSGNAGMAWSAKANGSLLEMTGGTLTAITYKNGNSDEKFATFQQSGGTATFNVLDNYKLSTVEISGTAELKAKSLANRGTVRQSGGTSTFTTLENIYATSTIELSGTAKMQVETMNNTGIVTLSGGDLYLTNLTNTGTLTVTPGGSLQIGTIGATKAETLTITGANKIAMNGQLVLDVYSQNSVDQISFTDKNYFTYGESAILALNLLNPDEYSPTETYTLKISDLGTDALNVKILGRDDFIGKMTSSNSVVFGSTNALPEPATWVLLLLGVGLLRGRCFQRR